MSELDFEDLFSYESAFVSGTRELSGEIVSLFTVLKEEYNIFSSSKVLSLSCNWYEEIYFSRIVEFIKQSREVMYAEIDDPELLENFENGAQELLRYGDEVDALSASQGPFNISISIYFSALPEEQELVSEVYQTINARLVSLLMRPRDDIRVEIETGEVKTYFHEEVSMDADKDPLVKLIQSGSFEIRVFNTSESYD